ncbi:hypothetical protein AK830_g12444 [Neonectria ditissima]|uniref:C2H2-type domain-containing protein n=1 Tax=Neonectria ditissima TaxID=78410 RepID=A0A0P7B0K4_9HYPO|nr:hypothetical protein AK830_g12444 [Neonectria ditissima]
MGQTQEDMATAIFDITRQCLDSFDRVVVKHNESILNHLFIPGDDPPTSNSQNIDLEPEDLSILSCDPTTSDPKALQTFLEKWEDASRAVGSALDRLQVIAVAIRRASAKRINDTITALYTEEDVVFRRDIASLVRYRFPAARKELSQQLADSVAVRREMLPHNYRHAKRLAVRRVPENVPSAKQHRNANLEPEVATTHQVKDRIARHLSTPRALTTVTSTISTTQEDSFEYPPAPTASEGETQVQCPFCFTPLECRDLEKDKNGHWERHIDEHLEPYGCLFPRCAESLVFFARRHEWKAHMESSHSKDWLRKVHTKVWYCDIDHDSPKTFETELQWRKHMQNLESHPKRKLKAPTQAQLDGLSSMKRKFPLRDEFVCPLCEQVPEEIRPLVEKGTGEPTDMYNFVVDHVADHMKSLSLMAVPSLGTTTQETSGIS